MKPTQTDTLRAELINLRACQNAHNYDYDSDIEARIRRVQAELTAIARRRVAQRNRRELMYDLNGHHGPA